MKILILGAGKMGTFFCDLLSFSHDVALYDPDPKRMRFIFNARRMLSLDEADEFAPDLLINAATVSHTIDAFRQALPHLPATCILSDIASVKSGLPEFYASAGHPFVSTHPMFGPTFASLDNLSHQNAIVISEGSDLGKAFFRDLYSSLHLNITEADFATHDQMMSYSLTVPMAATMAFANIAGRQEAPGTTFGRHIAIARGVTSEDENLLVEILMNPHSATRLDALIASLQTLRDAVASGNRPALRSYIASAASAVK